MGVTYQAQVEVYFGPTEIKAQGSWQSVCRWELQKDYMFSITINNHSAKGWPKDCDLIIGEEYSNNWQDEFGGKRQITGKTFRNLDSSEWFQWAIHLQKFVRELGDEQAVRVLIWQE